MTINTAPLSSHVTEVDQPVLTWFSGVQWMDRSCLTAEYLCLFPVPDNSSMQRGCPPGSTRGHQSSARRGQTLWKCPERCEAPDPRLSHPVVYQLSAAARRPVLLLTTLLWTKLKELLFFYFKRKKKVFSCLQSAGQVTNTWQETDTNSHQLS